MTTARAMGMATVVALVGTSLAGCQAFLPRDDTPRMLPTLAALPDPGPSSQRLDAQGYPMLGHRPTAATAQVSDEDVAATQNRFRNVGGRAAGSTSAVYTEQVRDLQALAARQQAEADAALAPAAGDAAASSRAQ